MRFPGLGESALPLTLLLHDARSVRKMGESGLPGRIVAMVEHYIFFTGASSKREAVSPNRAIEALVMGEVKWVPPKLAQVFAAWKGPVPLGSIIQLEPMGNAVVVGQGSHPDGKVRPVVAVLNEDGELGERIDLKDRHDVKIVGAPDPGKAGIRLKMLAGQREEESADQEEAAAPASQRAHSQRPSSHQLLQSPIPSAS
jgi:hypothetical protein